MFDRFTDRAKKSMNLARSAAQQFGQPYLGPEHVLHGVLSAGECKAWQILTANRVVVAEMLQGLAHRMPSAEAGVTNDRQLPFTLEAKRVLESAMEVSRQAGHGWIGTEHLLAGLSNSTSDIVAESFRERGVTFGMLRKALGAQDAAPTSPVAGAPITEDPRRRSLEAASRIAKQLGDDETAQRIAALIQRLPR